MRTNKKTTAFLAAAIGYPIILLVAIRLSSFPGNGLMELIVWANEEMSVRPFHFVYTPKVWSVMLMTTILYAGTAYVLISSMKNTRTNEEYGSARWANIFSINRKYRTKKKNIPEGLDADQTYILFGGRVRISIVSNCSNINVLIVGGSGTGKSRKFIIPNIMQLNSNFVITDPKGEILAKVGKLLKLFGYEVRVLDLKTHIKSWGYNPFRYFKDENDIFKFVNNMWEAMSDKTAQKGEQIWDDSAKNMLISIMMYLFYYAPKEEQNFDMVLEIVSIIEAGEENSKSNSNLKKKHERLFENIPHNSTAYRYYSMWNTAKGRTLSSIVSTLTAKIAVFSLPSMRQLTYNDEMDLLDLATKKVAIFLLLPDDNKVYNFIAGTLYTQVFQQLYDYADTVCHGPLPRHVRFYMDEFANIALPDDYEKILSTARSRNMSFVIVLQDKSQIEALYKETHKTLIANCAFKLFLGSYEKETCQYFSELLGKETISVYTYNRSYGMHGQTTKNEQKVGRELMTGDEIRTKLGADNCIIIANYDYPVMDRKYDMTEHKNYKYISDGKYTVENLFDWAVDNYSRGTVQRITSTYSGKITPLENIEPEEWQLMDIEDIDSLAA